ncbi:hypothetical protein CS006_08290 [Bifidobacterium primatium]|uniref:DUF3071 domain-containing protein n=1 Tax=Bifidobacterium primatium TaxID=2045438 RepID=A0A2M9H6X3_9BIFI|nr:hypothetical protein CS006_08290 [Bifidobacterium primatium]
MSNETLKVAHFERVSENGDLVFSVDGNTFAVRVDDRLEQGILASKQIRQEREGSPDPQASATIPISTIQSMIRAGYSPEEVARNYSVGEALVRRFAQPVETEKKYAISQFFSAPVPGIAKNRNVSDMIASSLRGAHVSMDSVQWRATRNGREPWRIHASFETAGRPIKAEWSWDMRDNSVTPMNPTARKLLKSAEFEAAASHDLFDDGLGPIPVSAGSPTDGDNVRIVDNPSVSPAAQTAPVPLPSEEQTAAHDRRTTVSADAATEPDSTTDDAQATGSWLYGDAGSARQPASDAHGSPKASTGDAPLPPLVPSAQDGETDDARQKRKGRRSAVPSWDEILFGE